MAHQFLIYLEPEKIEFFQIKNSGRDFLSLKFIKNKPVEIDNNSAKILATLKTTFEEEKNIAAGQKIFLVLAPLLLNVFCKLIPAASVEEIKENLIFEIEEEIGKMPADFIFGYKIREKTLESGLQKIKVEIGLMSKNLFQEIKQFGPEIKVFTGEWKKNQTPAFINLNEFIEFKETDQKKFYLPSLKKLGLALFLIIFLFLAGQKWLFSKKESQLNSAATTQEFTLTTATLETPRLELTSLSPPAGAAIFTYETNQNAEISGTEPKLVGIVTGVEKMALIKSGPVISAFKPGQKISDELALKEIFEEKITVVDKNKKTKEIFLYPEIF